MSDTAPCLHSGKSFVRIGPSAGIDTAAALHEKLTEAADAGLPVCLDVSEVTDCDASFIQQLASLCHTLCKSGRALELSDAGVPEPLRAAVTVLGFGFRTDCVRGIDSMCLLAAIAKAAPPSGGIA